MEKIDKKNFKYFFKKIINSDDFWEYNGTKYYKMFIKSVNNNNKLVIKTPRQIGMTSFIASHLCTFYDKNILYITPKPAIFKRTIHLIEMVTSKEINGNRIYNNLEECKAIGKLDLIIIDLSSYVKDFRNILDKIEYYYNDIKCIIISNPTNINDEFGKLYLETIQKKNEYGLLDLFRNPYEDIDKYNSWLHTLGEHSFAHEYIGQFPIDIIKTEKK